ncbi:MAG: hypothetical protein ACT4NV_02320 [Rhodoferax sp.]
MQEKAKNWSEKFLTEYIHGDRFAELADWSFNRDQALDELRPGGRDGVVFCCTHYVDRVFQLLSNQPHRFILITHNSDNNVTESLYSRKPSNIVHWFAQNVLAERDDLTPIPIGLERQGIVASRNIAETMLSQICAGRPAQQRWCYLNINPDTNDHERRHVLRALRWKWLFVTTRTRRIAYPQYVAEMASHRFVVSPPGNGVDCHRTWESLYLGSVPVVKDSACMRSFASAGLMIMPTLARLSRRDFLDYLDKPTCTDTRLLHMSYWRQRIATVVRELLPDASLPAALLQAS